MFNVTDELFNLGHEIIPFSIQYSQNVQTNYSKYFVTPIANKDAVYFDQQKNTPKTVFKTASRLFYSLEVKKAVERLVDASQPQVAYILHYLRKLSPSLLAGLKNKGIPIVVRLSDYAMLCPQAHFIRNDSPCTLCGKGDLFPSIKYKCIKDSFPASLLNLLATVYHRNMHYFDLIDVFICTNPFMYKMMINAGYPDDKLICIPTFTNINNFRPSNNYLKSNFIIFSGRITPLKGLHVLLEAMSHLKNKGYREVTLKIAGTGDQKYVALCKEIIKRHDIESQVEFIGAVDVTRLSDLLGKAIFSVVPSLWFENLPNSLIESFSCGTPVIASDIGSLSGCVNDYQTGFLFKPGDVPDLAEKMEYCLQNRELLKKMSINSREEAKQKYSSSNHIASLVNTFQSVL